MNTLSLNDLYVLNWYLNIPKDDSVENIYHIITKNATMREPDITHYPNGTEKSIVYKNNMKQIIYKNKFKKLHRDDGPAVIEYDNNDNKIEKKYYQNGKLHRDDGPAAIEYDENGNKHREEYYQNGIYHRDESGPNGGPALITYYPNGKLYQELYYQTGKLNRDDGPAAIEYDENGKLHRKSYYQHGKLHRNNEPAMIEYYPNGNIKLEEYYRNGELHRDDDKPAAIKYDENGNKKHEKYYQNGELHRDDGHALIEYYKNGNTEREIYYQHGEFHRDNGPALITYYPNGKKEQEEYYQNNKLHRDKESNGNDQPAVITYDENGNIIQKRYYKDGVEYFPRSKQTIAKPLTLEKTYKSAVGDARLRLKQEYSKQKFDYTRKTTDWEELCHDNARSVDELRVLLKTHNKEIQGNKSEVCAELARDYTSEKDKQIKPICNNDQTAVMFEDLTSIPRNRIWTYIDEKNITWCFDLVDDVQWLRDQKYFTINQDTKEQVVTDDGVNPWNKQPIPVDQVRLFLTAAAQYTPTTVSPFEKGGLHYKQDRIVMGKAENVDVIALELENFLTDYFINEKLEYSSVAHVIKAFHDKKLGNILYKLKIQYPTLETYNFNYDEKLPEQEKVRRIKELLKKIAEIPDVTKKSVYYQIQELSKHIYDI